MGVCVYSKIPFSVLLHSCLLWSRAGIKAWSTLSLIRWTEAKRKVFGISRLSLQKGKISDRKPDDLEHSWGEGQTNLPGGSS